MTSDTVERFVVKVSPSASPNQAIVFSLSRTSVASSVPALNRPALMSISEPVLATLGVRLPPV